MARPIALRYEKPPMKTPFVIWLDRDSRYRIVCVRVAAGTADFAFERSDGSDSMGVQHWSREAASSNLTTSLAYDLLDEVCPDWRSIQ